MTTRTHSEEQIIGVLQEAKTSAKTPELVRWRGGDLQLEALVWRAGDVQGPSTEGPERKNAELRRLLTDTALDSIALKDVLTLTVMRQAVAQSYLLSAGLAQR